RAHAVVTALPLRDCGQDAVEQTTAGSLVDVLLDADECDVGRVQLEDDVGVVATVAGQAIDLVDDDVVDVTLGADAGKHGLELGPVGGLGRLTAVDVDPDDLRAQ